MKVRSSVAAITLVFPLVPLLLVVAAPGCFSSSPVVTALVNDASLTDATTDAGSDGDVGVETDGGVTIAEDATVVTADASLDATTVVDAGGDAGNVIVPLDAAADVAVEAASPSGPPPSCNDTDSGPVTTTVAGAGCADGTREGFVDSAAFPDIAACVGTWSGTVDNASATLCAAGWHVCNGTEPPFTAIAYADATAFCGCYAIDAAQDNYTCHPGCSAAVLAGVDSAENIDMGGLGASCILPTGGGCLASGRIDSSENNGYGCNDSPTIDGVACCRNVAGDAGADGGT